jgi:quinol monooxygenase YgiN
MGFQNAKTNKMKVDKSTRYLPIDTSGLFLTSLCSKYKAMQLLGKFSLTLALTVTTLLISETTYGQEKRQMVRLAKIVVDPAQLEQFKAILKEEAEASVQKEPGVLTLYAVSEKENPNHFTILEIYADSAAYKAHLQTPHFIKYKTGTKDMIKSLELVETTPLIPEMKIK